MLDRLKRRTVALLALLLGGGGLLISRYSLPPPLPRAAFEALYANPTQVSKDPSNVYHLGHSLVGTNMPILLRQLAQAGVGAGHSYNSQLGWGTVLKAHWDPDTPIKGFEESNADPAYRDAPVRPSPRVNMTLWF